MVAYRAVYTVVAFVGSIDVQVCGGCGISEIVKGARRLADKCSIPGSAAWSIWSNDAVGIPASIVGSQT